MKRFDPGDILISKEMMKYEDPTVGGTLQSLSLGVLPNLHPSQAHCRKGIVHARFHMRGVILRMGGREKPHSPGLLRGTMPATYNSHRSA